MYPFFPFGLTYFICKITSRSIRVVASNLNLNGHIQLVVTILNKAAVDTIFFSIFYSKYCFPFEVQ